ncbi:helix-turn-helix transcriptional regulator [Aeromicrobium alkaliterrae]|uniref:helix-turn-helix domain-containing protein n=1 Tax=Aeromicrobium alkaliterrae TaxID=302168 RepID=UPI0031D24E98
MGERIRARRKQQGVSQEDLAHAAGLDRSYVGAVERGERNLGIDNLHRLAEALRCEARELL